MLLIRETHLDSGKPTARIKRRDGYVFIALLFEAWKRTGKCPQDRVVDRRFTPPVCTSQQNDVSVKVEREFACKGTKALNV
jgi:hypothetical protein